MRHEKYANIRANSFDDKNGVDNMKLTLLEEEKPRTVWNCVSVWYFSDCGGLLCDRLYYVGSVLRGTFDKDGDKKKSTLAVSGRIDKKIRIA